MKLYQNTNKHTWFNGWYGVCDSECQTLNLNQPEFESIFTLFTNSQVMEQHIKVSLTTQMIF